MRSDFVQIIAITGMILMAVLAIRFWGTEAPKMPALPSFQMPLPQATPDTLVEVACPIQTGVEVSEDPQPKWTVPPTPTERNFPNAALNAGIGGEASVICLAMPDGRVEGCRVATEIPAGYGFGESAIRIVQRGCLTRFSEELPPVEFTVRVPFTLD